MAGGAPAADPAPGDAAGAADGAAAGEHGGAIPVTVVKIVDQSKGGAGP
eukprot:gene291-4376_t